LTVRLARLARPGKIGLHLLLAAGILFYLYSPLLDHWLGHGAHSRPHNHVHLTHSFTLEEAHLHEAEPAGRHDAAGEEEGVLCYLDLDLLLALVFLFDAPHAPLAQQDSLVFASSPASAGVSLVYLTALDPPPNL
jgi:hypothetical protein